MGSSRLCLAGLALVAPFVLTSVVALAGPKPGPTTAVAPTASHATVQTPPQPDVGIYDLSVDADCHIVVHLINAGSAPVPASTTSIALQMSGANASGWSIHDSSLPREPGAKTTFTVPTYRVNGSIKQTATLTGVGSDLSKTNTSHTEMLACTSKFADMALTVTTKPDCTKVVELANVGDAAPAPNTWAALSITRTNDGFNYEPILLSALDPAHALQTPGGKVTLAEPSTFRAFDSFTYSLNYPYQEKNDSKANNTVSASVPAQCKQRRPIDITLTEVKLDAACRIVATAKNVGSAPLPPAPVTATFSKDGVLAGSWSLDASKVAAPGSEAIISGPFLAGTTPVTVKVVVDATNVLSETNEDNNTVSVKLSCPK